MTCICIIVTLIFCMGILLLLAFFFCCVFMVMYSYLSEKLILILMCISRLKVMILLSIIILNIFFTSIFCFVPDNYKLL